MNKTIARRWFNTDSFEWIAGMCAHDNRGRCWRLYTDVTGSIAAILEGDTLTVEWTGEYVEIIDAVPDMTDLATKCILLAQANYSYPDEVPLESYLAALEEDSS